MRFVVGLVFVALCIGIYLSLGYLLCMLEKRMNFYIGNEAGHFDFADLCFWPIKAIGHLIFIPKRLADHLNEKMTEEDSSEKIGGQNKTSRI